MKEKIIKFIRTFFIAIIISVIACIVLLNIQCTSFEPVIIKGQPGECNDVYTIMKLITENNKSINPFVKKETPDYSILVLLIEDCRKARKIIREDVKKDECKNKIYGDMPVSRNDYKKYADYADCLRE